MANMLRRSTTKHMTCCSHCERKKPGHLKFGGRERRLARAKEKRLWQRQEMA